MGEDSNSQQGDLIRAGSFDLLVEQIAQLVAELMRFEQEGRRREWVLTRLGAEFPVDVKNEEIVANLIGQQRVERSHPVHQCAKCGALFVSKHSFSWREFWQFQSVDAPVDMIARMD
jgi:hypothetical protein